MSVSALPNFCTDQEFNVYPLELGRKLFKILPMANLQHGIVKPLEYFFLDYARTFIWWIKYHKQRL